MTQETQRRVGTSAVRLCGAFMIALPLCAVLIGSGRALELSASPDGRRAAMEAAITTFMAESKVPGISVAVVQDGQLAWSAGFGMADLENSVAATSETVYRLGSISKALTATAAMALWEHGRLDLDAPIQKYCPTFPTKPWPITTRQLLSHLGGIRSYKVPEYPYTRSQADPEVGNTVNFKDGIAAGLRFFASEPLVAPPGTRFHYSTQGYTLVSCAMEGAAAQAYERLVRRSVLEPAGMTRTQPDDRLAIVPLRTRFYSKDESGAVVNAEFLDASYKVAGGGWLSSAPDLARFAVAVLSDRLVTRATRDVMWTQEMPSDGLGRMGYGLGWQLGTTAGIGLVGHGGSQQGTSSMLLIAPEKQAAVIVLTNSDGVGASGLAVRLLRIALDLSEPDHIEVAPEVYSFYPGRYRLMDFSITIGVEDGRHVAEYAGRKIALLPTSSHDYVLENTDVELTFVVDRDKRVKELIVHEGGTDLYLSPSK